MAAVMYELRDLKKDEDLICKALKASDAEMKINITQPYNYEQMLKLLAWTTKHDLRLGKKLKFGGDLEWKHEIVDLLATIFKKGCTTITVPESYTNIMKEIVMIYYNSLTPPKGGKPPVIPGKSGKEAWKKILEKLKKCAEEEKPLLLESDGLEV